MTHWSQKRRASLAVHVAFVAIPFVISTVSAGFFWHALFQTLWIVIPLVTVIDLLALTGLVLFITKIESPFTTLRHLLPFVSIVPLGWELYGVLIQHNTPLLSTIVAGLVTAILVVIAWKCFTTIERLFIDPVEAARERARERVAELGVQLAGLRATDDEVAGFIAEYQRGSRAMITGSSTPPQNAAQLPVGPDYAAFSEDPESIANTVEVVLPPPPLRRKPSTEGHVYVLYAPDSGYYKIGRTSSLNERVSSIAGFVPFPIELVHSFQTDNMIRLERGLHRVYETAKKRINGEWFQLSTDDLALLKSLGDALEGDAVETAIEVIGLSVLSLAPPTDPAVVPASKKQAVLDMRAAGRSWREIADMMQRSPTTVRGWVNGASEAVEDASEAGN